jgi:hypothetical protein
VSAIEVDEKARMDGRGQAGKEAMMKTTQLNTTNGDGASAAVVSLLKPDAAPPLASAIGAAAAVPADPLTDHERTRLTELEGVIRRGKETFIEVGLALAEVRQARLYRENYRTFEEYCGEEWELSARQAQQIRNAAEVVRILRLDLDANKSSFLLPANEAQARPLTALGTKELQIQAWHEAVRTAPGGKVTGKHVESVIRRLLKPAEPAAAGAAADPGLATAPPTTGRAARRLKTAEAAIAKARELKDEIGTPDSLAANGVVQALALLQDYRNHLEKQEELHSARR